MDPQTKISGIRKKAIKGIKENDVFSVARTFTEKDVLHFGEVSRDYNPVHYNEKFAREKNFRSRICHGLLVAGLMTEIGGQLGWLATGMDFKFKKPVYVGDRVTCTLTITETKNNYKVKAHGVYLNQYGEEVLECFVEGILPGDKEVELMIE